MLTESSWPVAAQLIASISTSLCQHFWTRAAHGGSISPPPVRSVGIDNISEHVALTCTLTSHTFGHMRWMRSSRQKVSRRLT